MTKPSLASLTTLYLKIGNTTFGGGNPTMALLQRELIRRAWITREDFALAYSLARVTPGTNVLAFCAATGARVLGITGAIAAVLAVTLPSAFIAVLLTRGFETWRGRDNFFTALMFRTRQDSPTEGELCHRLLPARRRRASPSVKS